MGRERLDGIGMRRAERVKEYLVNTWEILPERISTEDGELPPKPALERSEEGFRENAYVGLLSSDHRVMLPVFREHIQRVATPPSVTFYPKAIAEVGVREWQLDIKGEKGVWKSIVGSGALPDSVRWDWTSDSGQLPTIPIELTYHLTIQDSALQEASTPSTLIDVQLNTIEDKLENNINDTVIESYSLLLFDYDSPNVSTFDRGLIRGIARLIREGAVVRFTGYTDSLGDERRNNELALQRAEEAAKIFQQAAPEDVQVIIERYWRRARTFPVQYSRGTFV